MCARCVPASIEDQRFDCSFFGRWRFSLRCYRTHYVMMRFCSGITQHISMPKQKYTNEVESLCKSRSIQILSIPSWIPRLYRSRCHLRNLEENHTLAHLVFNVDKFETISLFLLTDFLNWKLYRHIDIFQQSISRSHSKQFQIFLAGWTRLVPSAMIAGAWLYKFHSCAHHTEKRFISNIPCNMRGC